MATKMLILGINKAYDTVLLLSGDKDYLEMVAFLRNQGLRVEIISSISICIIIRLRKPKNHYIG
ncbi:MAG: NYN domain-containing protein [Treponema sp.]|nr:NYN domain-containing protein [Treponema sp.]